MHPDNANAAYELGEMRRKSKQNEEAQKYFEQAIQHYPDFAEAQLGLAAVLLEKPTRTSAASCTASRGRRSGERGLLVPASENPEEFGQSS